MEGIHGSWRLILMYNVGVLGGAFFCFLSSAHTAVMGMSGGCYALVGMHVADLLMNWRRKRYRKPIILMLVILLSADIVQLQFMREAGVSYMAHIGGAIFGLCMGFAVGKNYSDHQYQSSFRRLASMVVVLLSSVALLWLAVTWPPKNIGEEIGWCWHRQAFNVSLFGNGWQCIRCGNHSCIEHWRSVVKTRHVSLAICSSRGWVRS